ncbi:Vgr family protein [Elizabethkingia meningoseptica]|uniref:type VI secretion system Vgr family protein n=1 Tax=Elizabethkingia meningoseptica TaxID=238 RepID=UPI0023AFFDBB|nr:phage baseplate assembly protein V [Elizabethkingia meningoseptica]MDE5436838.1 Vgr family protein [Elizabethkingia meningoseptica]MDE5509136.1 Vgr family protein [Elizabethkingia meningoseptica]MDE5514653.1 Vgr family protein [Elizabethkingia meningoseptica]MDE5525339.1 Vgr family protein [Elizabethkingia meningoseptica]MDE5528919.1 Vgr family protein [Elizabethkingia meningoseptica]
MKNNSRPEEVLFSQPKFSPDNNADGIKGNHQAGINRLVKLSIVVEGQIIKYYKHFKLKQSARGHHSFELTLAHDALGERQDHQLEKAYQFLGNRLTIKMMYKDLASSPERVFVGVITGVGFSQDSHSLGNIVLKGYSPTILLDAAPHTQSFGGEQPVNMGIIATNIIKQGIDSGKYDVRVDAKAASQILYSAQYDETHYNYLSRMAEAYGEQFYYDGEVLHFGNMPPQNKPIELTYGSNVNNVQVEVKAVHIKPQYYGYNSSSNTKLTSGGTPVNHKSDLAQKAYQNNGGIFKTPSLRVAPIKAVTDKDVVNAQTSTSGSQAVEVFTVSGGTTVPFLYPGCVADIKMRKPDTNQTSYFTKLMITEVEHEIDTLGHYNGSFVAIASDTGYMPKPDFELPVAQPQIATVISNTDPEGQGRVIVKFDWQENDTTNFIRVMSPDAGGTDQITQNRGYVAIPEVGDQVMVGFVHNHPDRPFVMGGMFHGGTALGGGINNHLKSIQTRSGIKVLMNDAEGSVNIIDPSGNTYFMDGKGNITVTAPKDMNFNAGANLNISVGQNMITTVGKDQTNTIGMNRMDNITMNHTESVGMIRTSSIMGDSNMFVTGKLTEVIDGDVHSETKQERNEISGMSMNIQSEEYINKHAQKEVQNNSGEKSKAN